MSSSAKKIKWQFVGHTGLAKACGRNLPARKIEPLYVQTQWVHAFSLEVFLCGHVTPVHWKHMSAWIAEYFDGMCHLCRRQGGT